MSGSFNVKSRVKEANSSVKWSLKSKVFMLSKRSDSKLSPRLQIIDSYLKKQILINQIKSNYQTGRYGNAFTEFDLACRARSVTLTIQNSPTIYFRMRSDCIPLREAFFSNGIDIFHHFSLLISTGPIVEKILKIDNLPNELRARILSYLPTSMTTRNRNEFWARVSSRDIYHWGAPTDNQISKSLLLDSASRKARTIHRIRLVERNNDDE